MFVIERTDQGGGYLAKSPIRGPSYVHDLRKAEIFDTREAAERGRCPDNERVRDVRELLGANR